MLDRGRILIIHSLSGFSKMKVFNVGSILISCVMI